MCKEYSQNITTWLESMEKLQNILRINGLIDRIICKASLGVA